MRFGIQRKLAVSFSIFMIVVCGLSSWAIVSYCTRLARTYIQDQQFAMTELTARSIDDKLGNYLQAIAQTAEAVPDDVFTSRRKATDFLQDHHELRSIFDDGLVILDRQGRPFAEYPPTPGGRDKELAQLKPFLAKIDSYGLPDISDPYVSARTHAPIIAVAERIEDSQHRPIGYLIGSINITRDYYMEELMGYKLGKKGYLYLFNTEGTVILHPEKDRILTRKIRFGVNKLVDKALQGFEGSGETVNAHGVHQLVSFKRLRLVDWILATVYQREEAYQPIRKLQLYLITAAIAITGISVILIWLLASRITARLNHFTRQVVEITANPDTSHVVQLRHMVQLEREDEVGVLAESFNALLASIDAKNEALEQQKELLEQKTQKLEKALADVKVLSGMIPICAWCKKIRNDEGYWEQLELYISDHSNADFTHGICPECREKNQE